MPSFERVLAEKEASLGPNSPPAPPADAIANPFAQMNIADFSFLDSVSDRSVCPLCSKRRKFFCYGCYVPMPEIAEKVPAVSLPLKLQIVKHPKEVEGEGSLRSELVLTWL